MKVLKSNHSPAPDKIDLQHVSLIATAVIVYELDVDTNIVAVNPVWQSFALKNQPPELSLDLVIGKPLMQSMSGNATKQFWQTRLDKARVATRLCILIIVATHLIYAALCV